MDLNTGLGIFGAVAALISLLDLAFKYRPILFKKAFKANQRKSKNKSITTTTSKLPVTLALSDNLLFLCSHHGSSKKPSTVRPSERFFYYM